MLSCRKLSRVGLADQLESVAQRGTRLCLIVLRMHIIINDNGVIAAEANIQYRFNAIEVRGRLLCFLHKYSWTLISNKPASLYVGVIP